MTCFAPLTGLDRGSAAVAALRTIGLAAALALTSGSALAKPEVSGSPEAVRIEAHNASIDEILAALAGSFNLNYKSLAALDKQ